MSDDVITAQKGTEARKCADELLALHTSSEVGEVGVAQKAVRLCHTVALLDPLAHDF